MKTFSTKLTIYCMTLFEQIMIFLIKKKKLLNFFLNQNLLLIAISIFFVIFSHISGGEFFGDFCGLNFFFYMFFSQIQKIFIYSKIVGKNFNKYAFSSLKHDCKATKCAVLTCILFLNSPGTCLDAL